MTGNGSRPARKRGGQAANDNAKKHGGYSMARSTGHNAARPTDKKSANISDLIECLLKRQEEILEYATRSATAGNIDTAIKAMSIYGQNASRIGRMLQKTTGHLQPQDIEETLRVALDEAQVGLDEELRRDSERAEVKTT